MAPQVPALIAGYTPPIIDKYLDVTQDGYVGVVRYHNRNPAVGIRALLLHVQDGTQWGSWTWFHQTLASSTVMISKDGVIWNVVYESKAPWTNGDVNLPSQRMIAFMNRWGWDPNTWCVTIEHEGMSGGLPYTTAQLKATIWQCWQWLQKYPIEVIAGHYEINSVSRSYCPDPPPHAFVANVTNILGGATVPVEKPTEVYRPAWPVVSDSGVAWDGKADLTTTNSDGKRTVWYADKRTVTVSVDALNCRQWASNTANLTREALPKGTKVDVLGWVEGEEVDGERRWWVSVYGTRLWVGGTAEKPTKKAPVPTAPDDGVSKPDYGNNIELIPIVLNGNTYYPTARRADGKAMKVTLLENGNVRLWAATHQWSPVQRTLTKGTTVEVGYWVKGEEVTQTVGGKPVTSNKWFVIGDGKDAVTKGGRIWAGMVAEAS